MIYLDANVIIRLIEGAPAIKAPIVSRLTGASAFVTSQLSRIECRCQPMRVADRALLKLYDEFFSAAELTLMDIGLQVIDTATDLRATHKLKTPDAIHIATAITCGATVFLTGDRDLTRISDVPVELI